MRLRSLTTAQILRADFFAPVDTDLCCSRAPYQHKTPIRTQLLSHSYTSEQDFDASLQVVTLKPHARPLTEGEIAMIWQVFRDSIDYQKVRVHDQPYLPFGLQPKNVAMTPDGELYFNESECKADFSLHSSEVKHWFMHEMTHVWQYQLRYPVKLRGAIRIGLNYNYVLAKGRRLCDYNMEAQGDLLADYFVLKYLSAPNALAQEKYRTDLKLFEEVLHDFLNNPKVSSNLPDAHLSRDTGGNFN